MKPQIILTVATALFFSSCTKNEPSAKLKTLVAQIPNEGLGSVVLASVFELTGNGTKNCFRDTTLTTSYSNVLDAHESREVVQVPSIDFPGEFTDSVIVTKADMNYFNKVVITGLFDNDRMVEVISIHLNYELIVDGIFLGEFSSVFISPDDFNQNPDFKFCVNKAIKAQSLELLTPVQMRKQRLAGALIE